MEMKKKSGFTLIEMLVTLGIASVLAVIASTSLFALLRSAAKTETIKEVKQNGDYALSVLAVKLRNTRSVTSACDGIAYTSITIANKDDTTSTFACVYDTSYDIYRIRERINETTETTFLTNSSVAVVSQGRQGCDRTGLAFTCTQLGQGSGQRVDIKFRLAQSELSAEIRENTYQTFSTQVVLRNY